MPEYLLRDIVLLDKLAEHRTRQLNKQGVDAL